MTTESKQRAANIKARREAVGISFAGFYDALNLTERQGEFVENGQYGKVTTEHRELAEKFLDHLESKKELATKVPHFILPKQVGTGVDLPASRYLKVTREGLSCTQAGELIRNRRGEMGIQREALICALCLTPDQVHLIETGHYDHKWVDYANKIWDHLDMIERERNLREPAETSREDLIKPQQIKRIAEVNSKWYWVDTVPVAGAKLTFRILPNDGKEFTQEELAAFPPLDLTPKPEPVYAKPHCFNDKQASQKQLEKFADGLCMSLLKSNRDIVTIPWAEFYELLYAATGCGQFNIELLDSIFSNLTCCAVPFLISYGNNVVVVCKDALFAPIEYP